MTASRFLVTGGAGFIGSHLTMSLLDSGHEVMVVDNLDGYYPLEFKERNIALFRDREGASFTRLDITDAAAFEEVVQRFQPQAIAHLAAQPGVQFSLEQPLKVQRVNVEGTMAVLEAARKHGVERVLNASSSSVYGHAQDPPFTETGATVPLSPYGTSKLAAEHLCRNQTEIFGLDTISLRFFTVYGPRMRPDLAIWIFTLCALTGQPIEIYGTGGKERDFTHVSDVVHSCMAFLTGGITGQGRAVNLGRGDRITITDLAETLVDLVGEGVPIEYHPDRLADMEVTCASTALCAEVFGWTPQLTLQDGLRDFVAWMRESRRTDG